MAKSSSAFLRSQIDFVRVACCEGCWDGVRRPCSIPEKDSLKCAFLSLVLFGANCLIRTKSHRWRLVAGRKVIVVSENAHAPQKKNRTLPPKWGRLITNSEFVSCLVAQRITGMLAGMSGLLPPSFNSIHSPICKATTHQNDSPFRKAKTQMGSSALKCSGRTSKELQTVLQDPSAVHSTHRRSFASIHK